MMEQAISESNRTKAKVVEDFKSIVNDADDLLQATDDYVKGNPWTAVGIAAGVGILIGFLFGKR
jgi:ElaB/YqjD/DUF883 family membrane-anchored ribosome-binding protein